MAYASGVVERHCGECGAAITRQSKSGLCRLHAMRRLHADPGYCERRMAALQRHFAQPGVREACAERLATWRRNMPAAERERLREWGRHLVREHLSQPEVRARSQRPEARAAAIAGNDAAKMGWCPPELRAAYHRLVRSKKIPAREARRIIEAEIEGTAEHARREIASRELAMTLREERRRREAY